jgi:F-type H+-transporting ATPase subunit b
MLTVMTALAAAASGAAAQGGKASGGLPQLNTLDFAPQLIWLAITFVLLYFLLSKMALPRVGEVIEERADRIRKDLDEAQRLKTETETAMVAYQQSLTEARASAQRIVQENRDKVSAELARERSDVEARLASMTSAAEARIGKAKTDALSKIDEVARDTAGALVESLIGEKVSADEIARAVASVRS